MPVAPRSTVAPEDDTDFARRVIDWQRRHGRQDLPWQRTRDPYRIWLSEIMLQQTQVATVIPYYARFLERFPDLAALAAAPAAAVLECWAGLGYYARGRNLHACAQRLVTDHGGCFPREPAQIADLPGIGRSTAAAIAAFAFGTRAAILDGNVKRVLTRCFGIDGFPGLAAVERDLWRLAESLLPDDGIEAYTQGVMDLGATLCTRSRPRCGDCPLRGRCVAERDGRQDALPAAKPARPLPARETTVTFFIDGERVLLERRPPTGLWGGLLTAPEGTADELAPRLGLQPLATVAMAPLQHTFTHFRLTLRPQRCRVAPAPAAGDGSRFEWMALADYRSAALPTPMRKLLATLLADDA